MDYWSHRFRYLMDNGYGADNSSVEDQDVVAAVNGIRYHMKTYCENLQGGTLPENVDLLEGYINSRAGGDASWTVTTTNCTDAEPDDQFQMVVNEIDKGHPPMVHYRSTPLDGCYETIPADHSGVAQGYLDSGGDKRFVDAISVLTGGYTQPYTTLFWGMSGQKEERYITTVTPGCWTLSSPDDTGLCMTFDDVPEGHWGRRSVDKLSCMCVVRGDPDGYFRPNNHVTKAEFLKMVIRLAFEVDKDGVRKVTPDGKFCDKRHWASGYIEYANSQGMLGPQILTNGVFLAEEPITRKEAAYLLVQAGKNSPQWLFQQMHNDYGCYKNKDTRANNPYVDFEAEDYLPDFYDHILATTNRCVFEGRKIDSSDPNTDREFLPDTPISRIEAAKVVCTARFGHESGICSDQHDCLPLEGTPPACP